MAAARKLRQGARKCVVALLATACYSTCDAFQLAPWGLGQAHRRAPFLGVSVERTQPSAYHVDRPRRSGALEMGRRKGELRKQLEDDGSAPSSKKSKRKGARASPTPDAPVAMSRPDLGPGELEMLPSAVAVADDDAEAPETTVVSSASGAAAAAGSRIAALVDPSSLKGEDLLRYLKANNLAVDLGTMQPAVLPRDARAKVAACFPVPTEELISQYGLGATPLPQQLADAMAELYPVGSDDIGKLKEFCLANRQHMGRRATACVHALKLLAMSKGDRQGALRMQRAAEGLLRAESSITAPFRQAMKDAEARLAPYMGSTEVTAFSGRDSADTTATWLVVKACVAEWEKRWREARGDDNSMVKFFQDATMAEKAGILDLNKDRVGRICGAVQQMSLAFSANTELVGRLTPEVRFLEKVLALNTTTEVRRYALKDFCPQEGMTIESLRLRLRSLLAGIERLTRGSYTQLLVAVQDVYDSLAAGTPDAYNIFDNNMDALAFKTYENDNPGVTGVLPSVKRMMSQRIVSIEEEYDKMFDFFNPELILTDLLAPQRESPKEHWMSMLDDLRPPPREEEDYFGEGEDEGDVFDDFRKMYLSGDDDADAGSGNMAEAAGAVNGEAAGAVDDSAVTEKVVA